MKKKLTIVLIAVLALVVVASVAMAKRGANAWLGVYTQEIDKRLVKSLDLKVDQGAIVNDVVEDSPADLAGIQEDDVILAVGGQKVTDPDDLIDLIDAARPGDSVTITVQRADKKLELPVVLESRRTSGRNHSFSWNWDAPRAPRVPDVPDVPDVPGSRHFYLFSGDDYGYIGVRLVNLSREAATALGADNGGTLVDEVLEDTPAEEAGVKPGDIIVSVDGDKVRDSEDLQDFIRGLDDGEVAKLGIVRDRKPMTLDVKVKVRESNYRWSRHNDHNNWFRNSDLMDLRDKLNSDEYRGQMKELQKELEEMREDLKELHEKLD